MSFGEYAQCTVANTDRSMVPRTEDCIVMLPTGNRTESVKMMSIRTGKLVTRDQFILLPMLSSVITRLNEMAAAEGRITSNRPSIVYDAERGLQKDYISGQQPKTTDHSRLSRRKLGTVTESVRSPTLT